jgi:hypothetical protein
MDIDLSGPSTSVSHPGSSTSQASAAVDSDSDFENDEERLDFLIFNENHFVDIPSDDDFNLDDLYVDEVLTNHNPTRREKFRKLVIEQGLTHKQTNALLSLLRETWNDRDIPVSSITLFKLEKKDLKLNAVAPGHYLHLGIKDTLTAANFPFLLTCDKIIIDICIDGVPLVKSSRLCMWPILGAFVDRRTENPFMLGVYIGRGNPKSISDFLQEFVNEVQSLEGRLEIEGRSVEFSIRAYCCDAPARSFLASVRYHTAKKGCSKCFQIGQRVDSTMTFQNHVVGCRTDASYKSRSDPGFHSVAFLDKEHPLERIGVGMISQVPLEPLHLLDLGIMKKLLGLFIPNLSKQYFATNELLAKTERHHLSITIFVPSEFGRSPREFIEFSRLKGVEGRLWLVYTGPVTLKDTLRPEFYQSFLKLHIAVRFLYMSKELDLAEKMLESFVQDFGPIFPEKALTYNVHSLLHLRADVEKFGLESMSNYKFENNMQVIKNELRSSTHIFRQVSNAVQKGKFVKSNYSYDKVTFSSAIKDNHCLLKDGTIVEIFDIQGDMASAKRYLSSGVTRFYEDQVPKVKEMNVFLSDPKLKILNVFVIDPKQMAPNPIKFSIAKAVECKFFRMPYETKFVVFPILHTT